jgi:hypothetical protein
VATARPVVSGLGLSDGGVTKETLMSQQAVSRRRGGRRWRAQAVLRKQRTGRVRGLEGLAVVVLLTLGERPAAVRDAEGAPRSR